MLALVTTLIAFQATHAPFTIPDADFEQGGVLWQIPRGSSVTFETRPGPGNTAANRVARFPAGEPQAIWLTIAVGAGGEIDTPPSAAHLGMKVKFGIWFRLASNGFSSGDSITLRVRSDSAEIARGSIDPALVPSGPWHLLTVDYDPSVGRDGCIRHATSGLSAFVEVDAGGEVWFDDLRGQPFEYERWALDNESFEEGVTPGAAWSFEGAVTIETTDAAYYGKQSVRLADGNASVTQVLAAQVPLAGPQAGELPEAGAWVRILSDPTPDPDGEVRLRIFHAWDQRRASTLAPSTRRTLLAEAVLSLAAAGTQRWNYLETDAATAQPLPYLRSHMRRPRLELVLEKRGRGTVQFDFPQIGERHAVDGNPKRFVYANYVARFRNPDFAFDALVDAPTNELGKRWRNWYWGNPPACDPGSFVWLHDPRSLRAGSDPHDAGRRDLAVASWDTRPLPLLGAYDSRDPLIVDFHARLARTCGLDALMFGWYGQKAVELDQCAPRNQSVNGPALDELYGSIEARGCDLKVATKMNLLRHANNAWANPPPGCEFDSEHTLELKREGIRDDLIWLAESYYWERATLKRDGKMVIGVFDPERSFSVSDGPPTQMSEADWLWIKEGVESATGHGIQLLFDQAPLLSTSLETVGDWFAGIADGSAVWRLAPCEVCRFSDFEAFQNGVANTIEPIDIQDHFRTTIIGRPYRWWRMDDARRLGIAIVYPGYDDSGVSGWSNPNGTCASGGTRCTRVVSGAAACAPAPETCYLELAFEEAERSGMDWIQIPTWNDWNEMTVLEPRYCADYVQAVVTNLSSVPHPADEDRAWVLGRLLRAQAGIASFKRRSSFQPAAIDAIVHTFLRMNGGTPYY